ncbi:hypothetical protein P7C70_g9261, partial [Phenoliferia sp. Uapishka_3]
ETLKTFQDLQALKIKLDRVVAEFTPLSSVDDVSAFEGELRNMVGKTTMSMNEVGRLTAQLAQQKSRMEELRDTHRLESSSQSDALTSLASQLEPLTSQNATLSTELASAKATIASSTTEHSKLKQIAKEEEEKRTKALSLLRALRQKLVKAEKDKEEIELEKDKLRASESALAAAVTTDRARFDQEIVSLRAAQELQLSKMRSSFDRETHSIKVQRDREAQMKKAQFEMEVITAKSGHGKEIERRDGRIKELEKTVRELTEARDGVFDQLQLRTAEIESSRTRQESLEGKMEEMRYELNEANDKNVAIEEELEELRKVKREGVRDDGNTRRLLVEAEARYEGKLRDLEVRSRQLEKDRMETEEEMGRNLQERLKEVERMREIIVRKEVEYADSVHRSREREKRIEQSEKEVGELKERVRGLEEGLEGVKGDAERANKAEMAVREELNDRLQRASVLEQRLEEVQTKESTLRSNNKTLRDELRKLQSGALQSEKQRHPGVGYFASYGQTPPAASSSSTSSLFSPTGSEGSGRTISRSDSSSTLGSINLGASTSSSNGGGGGGGGGGATIN